MEDLHWGLAVTCANEGTKRYTSFQIKRHNVNVRCKSILCQLNVIILLARQRGLELK